MIDIFNDLNLFMNLLMLCSVKNKHIIFLCNLTESINVSKEYNILSK